MKTSGKKVAVKVACQEQQENLKNTRKTLKILQPAADKENLVGRMPPSIKSDTKPEKSELTARKLVHKSVQTGESVITEADLTSEEPSADYWKRLAEKRQESLNESLQENDRLKEHVEALKEENRICKDMLEESRHLVQVLQEMLEEEGVPTEAAEEEKS